MIFFLSYVLLFHLLQAADLLIPLQAAIIPISLTIHRLTSTNRFDSVNIASKKVVISSAVIADGVVLFNAGF